MLATVIGITAPVVVFLFVATTLGLALATILKKTAVASLLASALVMTALVAAKRHLPLEFSAYAQDFIYEPLIRDHFVRHPLEGFAAALFHFGAPCLLIVTLRRLFARAQLPRDRL